MSWTGKGPLGAVAAVHPRPAAGRLRRRRRVLHGCRFRAAGANGCGSDDGQELSLRGTAATHRTVKAAAQEVGAGQDRAARVRGSDMYGQRWRVRPFTRSIALPKVGGWERPHLCLHRMPLPSGSGCTRCVRQPVCRRKNSRLGQVCQPMRSVRWNEVRAPTPTQPRFAPSLTPWTLTRSGEPSWSPLSLDDTGHTPRSTHHDTGVPRPPAGGDGVARPRRGYRRRL